MICEFIDKFGEDTKIGMVLNHWFCEEEQEPMYEIISEWKVFYIPDKCIVTWFNEKSLHEANQIKLKRNK